VTPKWTHETEVYDNGPAFGVLRRGDTEREGLGIWVTFSDGGTAFRLCRRDLSGGEEVIRREVATANEASAVLDDLLEAMVGGREPTGRTAQEAFRQLLGQHLDAPLRSDGFQRSGNAYRMRRGDYDVRIRFQKARWSTRDAVDYLVSCHVEHPNTVALFNEANRAGRSRGRVFERPSAGEWQGALGSLAGRETPWARLRPDDDLGDHARRLLNDIREHLYPAIERELAPYPMAFDSKPTRLNLAARERRHD